MPLSATDNGDGTAKLQVDTELTATIDPTGLATSEKQDTGNSSLSSIDGKLPTLVGGKIPVDASVSIDSIDIGNVDISEFPAGNLGQQLKAASLSVAPATDITDATYIGDIKFGESLPSGTALVGKVSIDQVTANANEVVIKSITAGPLPDTSTSDLGHIHSNSDSIKTAVEVIDNCISGNEAQVDIVTLPVSFNAGADDATTQRVTLSTETLSALENVTINASALPTGAATSVNQAITNNIFGPTAPTPVAISFASGDAQTIIAAPAAGSRIRITSLFLSAATDVTVAMKSATTTIGTIYGMAFAKDWVQPLKLGTAEAFILDATTADQIYGQVCYYTEVV